MKPSNFIARVFGLGFGLLSCGLLFLSCSLDPFMFVEQKTDHYDLSTDVIPERRQEMVTFDSEGNTLYGFFVRQPPHFENGFTVLYCHGDGDNLADYWDRVGLLYDMGFQVLIFDYRGFGMSEGTSSLDGLYADGRAALDFLLTKMQVDSHSVVLYGHSLGNIVSIYLAAEQITPDALIAEAPFASGEALLQSATLLDLPGDFFLDESFDNVQYIREIHTRFLLIHGQEDDFVPYLTNGKVLFDNAPEPKDLALIPNAKHSDIPWVMGYERYSDLLNSFLYSR